MAGSSLLQGFIEKLGIQPGEEVNFRGQNYALGVIDTDAFDRCTTLDAAALTPYAPSSLSKEDMSRITAAVAEGAEVDTTSFIHLGSDQILIGSPALARSIGGNISSIELSPADDEAVDWTLLARELATELNVAVVAAHRGTVTSWRFVPDLGGKGIGAIIIPLILGGMIIFSTMLGSVAERAKRFSSIVHLGLAPLHVGALFLVEAGIYAVLGGMGGYLLRKWRGQDSTSWLIGVGLFDLISTTAVLPPLMVMIIIMIVVLISALYPAWVAAKSANPTSEESFAIPEPDDNDVIAFPFPFTVARRDIGGLGAYLHSYFLANQEAATGCFTSGDVTHELGDDTIAVGAKTWLAPFDLGISQRFKMQASPTDMNAIFGIDVELLASPVKNQPGNAWCHGLSKISAVSFWCGVALDEETRDRFRAKQGCDEAGTR